MIEVRELWKSFDEHKVVKDVNFSISKGEIVGLLGPNGAGKTTTMRMMTGYYHPDQGEILIGGKNIKEHKEEIQAMIGYLPESSASYSDMLVSDYLKFIAATRNMHGAEEKNAIERVVSQTSLQSYYYRPISVLSKGYRQRVGLAAAMLHDPPVLILDEPTSGLDPNQILDIQSLIASLAQEKTIILSTHILKEVEATSQRAIIIHDGRIVMDKPLEEIATLKGGASSIQVTVKGIVDNLDSLVENSVEGINITSQEFTPTGETIFRVATSGDAKECSAQLFRLAVKNEWILTELYREKFSLETVFRELTRGGNNE